MQQRRLRLPATAWGRLVLGIVLVIAMIATVAGYDRYAESRLAADHLAPASSSR